MAGLFSNMVSIEDEIAHCRRREDDERKAAARSIDVSAREAHLDLAARYAERARALAERQRYRSTPDSVERQATMTS